MNNQNNFQKLQLPSRGKIIRGIVLLIISGIGLRFWINYNNIEQERSTRYAIGQIFDKQEEHYKLFTQPFETEAKIEFAESIYELGNIYYSDSEKDYNFDMTRESPNTVIVTATAKKRGLKSFTASLFIKSGYLTRRLCETKKLSKTPPQIIRATDIENGCPSDAELYTEYPFNQENKITYTVDSIGYVGCAEYDAFSLAGGKMGHFTDFIDKYGLLDNEEFLLRVKELRNQRDYCNKNTAMVVCTQEGECAKAGFNISLTSSEDPNKILDIAVVSYMPPFNGAARPSGWPDLYVFDPTNMGMEWQTSTAVGGGSKEKDLSDQLKEILSIFLR
jgi:hypothetical protein